MVDETASRLQTRRGSNPTGPARRRQLSMGFYPKRGRDIFLRSESTLSGLVQSVTITAGNRIRRTLVFNPSPRTVRIYVY